MQTDSSVHVPVPQSEPIRLSFLGEVGMGN